MEYVSYLGRPVEFVLGLILPLYHDTLFAYMLAGAMTLVAAGLAAIAGVLHLGKMQALSRRIKTLKVGLTDGASPDDVREAFAAHWNEINAAFVERRRGTTERKLRTAWLEFRESLIDEDERPIRNTERPHVYFAHSVRSPQWLEFAANLFVGFGLLLTFLGLVAALTFAVEGMRSATIEEMQTSLNDLLAAASSKFVTSIAGVLLSIGLKMWERFLSGNLRRSTQSLCNHLEEGVLFTPLQSIAARQSTYIQEMNEQLKKLATDIAVQMSDRLNEGLQTAFTPMATSIAQLKDVVETSQQAQVEALREGVGNAVNQSAGGELQAATQGISRVVDEIARMQSGVSNTGDAAAQQIEAAAKRFESVVGDMKLSFEALANRLNRMGADLDTQSRASFEQSTGQVSELMKRLIVASDAQAKMVSSALAQIEDASNKAASSFSEQAAASARQLNESAVQVFEQANAANAEAMKSAGERLIEAILPAADRLERAGETFVRVEASLDRQATAFGETANSAQSASEGVRTAVTSLATSIMQAQGVLQQLDKNLSSQSESATSLMNASSKSLEQARALQLTITEQHQTLKAAWEDYSDRFEKVDEDLARAYEHVSSAFADAHKTTTDNVGKLDSHLGSAVQKLADVVTPLQELAEELRDEKRKAKSFA